MTDTFGQAVRGLDADGVINKAITRLIDLSAEGRSGRLSMTVSGGELPVS